MKKIFLQRKWLLIGIIVLAFILRFYRLGSYPAFNADEASIGYNAYSVLLTGKIPEIIPRNREKPIAAKIHGQEKRMIN